MMHLVASLVESHSVADSCIGMASSALCNAYIVESGDHIVVWTECTRCMTAQDGWPYRLDSNAAQGLRFRAVREERLMLKRKVGLLTSVAKVDLHNYESLRGASGPDV